MYIYVYILMNSLNLKDGFIHTLSLAKSHRSTCKIIFRCSDKKSLFSCVMFNVKTVPCAGTKCSQKQHFVSCLQSSVLDGVNLDLNPRPTSEAFFCTAERLWISILCTQSHIKTKSGLSDRSNRDSIIALCFMFMLY